MHLAVLQTVRVTGVGVMVMVAHTLLIPAQGMREKPESEANLIYTGSSRITRLTYSVSKFQNPKINKKPNTNNKNKMSREQGFQLSTGVLCLLPGIPHSWCSHFL